MCIRDSINSAVPHEFKNSGQRSGECGYLQYGMLIRLCFGKICATEDAVVIWKPFRFYKILVTKKSESEHIKSITSSSNNFYTLYT